MHSINLIDADEGASIFQDLVNLLEDSVESGASVGFLTPLTADQSKAYWLETLEQVESGNRMLLVARQSGKLTGSVQLDLATKQNALHRAEVQKLLVHTRFRNQGIAAALMQAVEDVARKFNRTLLVLDTLQGHAAEKLYEKWGYTRVGAIPDYARVNDGSLQPTVVFYKIL